MSEPLFDKSTEYDEMLSKGLQLSGEGKDYFMRGRIKDLIAHLPPGFQPRKILDYGCGLGETTHYLSQLFPNAQVVGADTSLNALHHAKVHFQNQSVSFLTVEDLSCRAPYDLCYTNGVFHHIPRESRPAAMKQIYDSLKPGGLFALFENNPFNPGTRLVMSRIAFDRDAEMLTPKEAQTLLCAGGFESLLSRFLFYFPKFLSMFRFLEPLGAKIPLGAQYYLLGTKR